MKRTLAALLLATPAFGQDVALEEVLTELETPQGTTVIENVEFHVTSPESVICPPVYTPMNCQRSVQIEPNVWYTTCESDIRGEENVWVEDEAGNQRMILDPNALRFSTTLEKWTDKRNEHVIDVRFRLTVKRHAAGWGQYNFVTRCDLCPYPYEHVQGNIYWDWTNAYEWHQLNATPEDWQMYEDHGVNFSGMTWKTRGSFGYGGDLYFGCRKINGKLYGGPTPNFSSRDIEWGGEMWRSVFPPTVPSNIHLQPPCDFDPSIPDSNDFAINLRITMSGRHVISSLDGEMLPQSQFIQIPNVVQFEAHAQFTIMDPVECQPVYEEDGGDSSMDEVIP